MSFIILIITALVISVLSLVIASSALAHHQRPIERQIVIEDEAISVQDGVIFAKGFSNEPFRTTRAPSLLGRDSITAHAISDGLTTMSEGNLDVKQSVRASGFTDGFTTIENGFLTGAKSVSAERLVISREVDAPAQYYASISVTPMNPINFSDTNVWCPLAINTKRTQLYFPGQQATHHGVVIQDANKIQLMKRGRWRYDLSGIITGEKGASISIALSSAKPRTSHVFSSTGTVAGSGIVVVEDIDSLVQLWAKHNERVTDYELAFSKGHLTLQYLGR